MHGPVFLPALPGALPAALVPGAPRHVCHSIILSGLPGSHYFTAAIIYSSAEPPACGQALTLTSLTAGQEPHSGRINHQARQQGACVPPREKIMLQTLRACQRLHFPMEEPAAWRSRAGWALESICARRETEAQIREGLPQGPKAHLSGSPYTSAQ